jgi:LuxR family transcriptional regulator, maltose regulon positive regulatory protein
MERIMAGSPTRVPEFAEPFALTELLATKLCVPRLPVGFVARQRLTNQLDAGSSRALTLVCAPPGCGKSVLLADWARSRDSPVAWLSLDAGDNDPVRFWSHVAAALDGVRPGIGERVESLLQAREPRSVEGLVTVIVNEMAAQDEDLWLVLDDYQLVVDAQVHRSLALLIERIPETVHVILSTRADPPLPLARLRARGHMAEVRLSELRFREAEVAALMRGALGRELDHDEVAALTTRTEGWAAGLRLAALSLSDQQDLAGFVRAFSGSHRYVLDYLTEEVLEQQSPTVRRFLLETSVLERLSGLLCDAVTGRDDSQQMLESIERANTFLVPLDEVRGWWRYHHLFADLLRARLLHEQPDQVRELHRSAACWHEEHGTFDEAIRHALAADDPQWSARILERHVDEPILRRGGATLQRWLTALPADLVKSRPTLLLAQAQLHLQQGTVSGVEPLLDAAEQALERPVDHEPRERPPGPAVRPPAERRALLGLLRAVVAHLRGDADATRRQATSALRQLGADEQAMTGTARALLASVEWMDGRLKEAERQMSANLVMWRSSVVPERAAMVSQYLGKLGKIQYCRGRLDSALDTYHQAIDAGGTPLRGEVGVAHVGIAEVAYQRDERERARQHAETGIEQCRQFAYIPPLTAGLTTLAWLRHWDGDLAGAREAMAEAEQLTDPEVVDLISPVGAERARLLLAQGEVEVAARWTADRGLGPDDEPSYPLEPAHLVLARVLLASDRPHEALRLLERLRAEAAAQQRAYSLIEIQALRALVLAADDDHAATNEALTEAVSLAQAPGCIRVFADEGRPMAELLGRLLAALDTERASGQVGYLGRLIRACAGSDHPSGAIPPDVPGMLSGREVEVLRLLAAGRTNREIADELYVSLHTVKKHATHIFDKLGATNRTEATSRARELGLIA